MAARVRCHGFVSCCKEWTVRIDQGSTAHRTVRWLLPQRALAQPARDSWLSWSALRWGKHPRTCLFSMSHRQSLTRVDSGSRQDPQRTTTRFNRVRSDLVVVKFTLITYTHNAGTACVDRQFSDSARVFSGRTSQYSVLVHFPILFSFSMGCQSACRAQAARLVLRLKASAVHTSTD
jgi:hypothetical protein